MSQLSQRCLRAAITRRTNLPYTQIRCVSWKRYGEKFTAKLEKAEKQWQWRAEQVKKGEAENLWDIFERRGFVKDIAAPSKEAIRELMRVKRIGAYVGIDPTATSLHIGHLLPLMPLYMMFMHGYLAVALIGGATAKIGDPIGRLEGRQPMEKGEAAKNFVKIHYQLKKLWAHVDERMRFYGYKEDWAMEKGLMNNSAWWNKTPLIEVLRRLGGSLRMGPMLGRESVKRRMTEGDGMSFAEFTYPLMQAWDWWTLFEQREIQMQIGGSDQFGNLMTGREAVKIIRETEHDPFIREKMTIPDLSEPVGFTVPLLTDSSGVKFGKSAGNAIWLDEFLTSPFDLYGYFVRRPDDEIERLLKLFTFIPCDQITPLMEESNKDPSQRLAHHRLAYEVLCLVHGQHIAAKTQKDHKETYSRDKTQTVEDLIRAPEFEHDPLKRSDHARLNNTPRNEVTLPRSLIFSDKPSAIARIIYAAGLSDSVSHGQRLAAAGGIYIGGSPGEPAVRNKGMLESQLTYLPVKTWFPEDTKNFVIDDKYLILRKGKHSIVIIKLMDDEEYKASGKMFPGQQYIGRTRGAIKKLREMKTMLGESEKRKAAGEHDDFDLIEEELREQDEREGKAELTERDLDAEIGAARESFRQSLKAVKRDGVKKKKVGKEDVSDTDNSLTRW